jgi:hypothetical protein
VLLLKELLLLLHLHLLGQVACKFGAELLFFDSSFTATGHTSVC